MNVTRTGMLVVVIIAGAAIAAGSQLAPPAFPHEAHARLFPACEGCHAGIVGDVADSVFPTYRDCLRCHDGVRLKRVEWRARTPRISNLDFSHSDHGRAVANAGDSVTCMTCHAASDPPRRMAVAGPDPQLCLRCHAHQGEMHIAPTATCRTCHISIAAAARMTVERISRFPRPAWHDSAGFGSEHGTVAGTQAASCAICHARESCDRCHANADRIPLIAALPRDARIASLQKDREPIYVAPASHQDDEWRTTHGATALQSTRSCANCHTRPSCETCHAGGSGTSRTAILTLPEPAPGRGPGVDPSRIDRAALHGADFESRHGTLAASGGVNCSQCHSERTCTACHAGQDSRRFHAVNFVQRHAADVFSSAADCQSCHNTERFCRDCHTRVGIAAQPGMSAAFHTGKSNWVLSHGQAARLGMASCASCHRQNDCVRCHSASGGWGINPHGSGFPASALAARNSAACRWCHVGPLPGGGS